MVNGAAYRLMCANSLLFYKHLEGLVTTRHCARQRVNKGCSNRGDKVNGKCTNHYNIKEGVWGAIREMELKVL